MPRPSRELAQQLQAAMDRHVGKERGAQTRFAALIGVTPAHISALSRATNTASRELIEKIAALPGENLDDWLKAGGFVTQEPFESERANITRLMGAVERLVSELEAQRSPSPAERLVDWLADFRRRTGRTIDVIPEGGVAALTHQAVDNIVEDAEALAVEEGWIKPSDDKTAKGGEESDVLRPNPLS